MRHYIIISRHLFRNFRKEHWFDAAKPRRNSPKINLRYDHVLVDSVRNSWVPTNYKTVKGLHLTQYGHSN